MMVITITFSIIPDKGNAVYEAPVQKGNTAILKQIDRDFKREESHRTPANQYQSVPERKQESIYVVMDGADSIQDKARGQAVVMNYPEDGDEEPIYFQEPSGGEIGFYDSFDDCEEDYAEMSTPSEHLRSVSMLSNPCTKLLSI